jgi:hypothetical protein
MARTSGREITVDRVRVRVLPDGRLDADNAARYMGRSPKTLAQWRLRGKGPPAHKVGGRGLLLSRRTGRLHRRGRQLR